MSKNGLTLANRNDFVLVKNHINDNFLKVDDDIDATWGGTYGGYIQDVSAKIVGQRYIDKINGKAYECIKAGNVTANTTEYFTDCNVADNLYKLKNLDIYTPITQLSSSILTKLPNGTKIYYTPIPYNAATDINTLDLSNVFTEIYSVVATVSELASEGFGGFYIIETRIVEKNKLQLKPSLVVNGVAEKPRNNLRLSLVITGN